MKNESSLMKKFFFILSVGILSAMSMESNEYEEIESIWSIQVKASRGDADAQYNLGEIFYEGTRGKNRDFKQAAECYALAADQGHTDAQYALGVCYDNGLGVNVNARGIGKVDKEKASKWYKMAADKGHQKAQFHLGYYYLEDERNIPEGLRLMHLAAAQGYVRALYGLGELYSRGYKDILPKDISKTVKYFFLIATYEIVEVEDALQSHLSFKLDEEEKWT